MNRLLRLALFTVVMSFSPLPAQAMSNLTDLDGNPAGFSDRLGNGSWLVVMVWAHDCHICNREIHEYEVLNFRGDELNLEVVGVSIDGADGLPEARAFVDRHQVTFDNFVGENMDVSSQYRNQTGQWLAGTPGFLVYGPEGRLRAATLGAVPADVIEDYVKNN